MMEYNNLVELAERYGYIVATPMGYNERGWYGARGQGNEFNQRQADAGPANLGAWSEQDVLNVLKQVRGDFNIDAKRIYLIGQSMGGGGTLYIGSKYADTWAALAAMAPAIYISPDTIAGARKLPVMVIQGDADTSVDPNVTRKWVAKMKELGMNYEVHRSTRRDSRERRTTRHRESVRISRENGHTTEKATRTRRSERGHHTPAICRNRWQRGRILALGNCVGSAQSRPGHDGRLTARLRTGVTTSLKSGPLGLGGSGRDGVIQMPSVIPSGPMPLLVFLHGATQSGARTIIRVSAAAEQLGIAVVAPDSRNGTWDAIRDEFDEDVVFLNKALDYVFERVNVDPARLAIGGFSDGASYGLSLGLVNGDLFPRVVACSPGFIIQAPSHGGRTSSSRTARRIRCSNRSAQPRHGAATAVHGLRRDVQGIRRTSRAAARDRKEALRWMTG